MKILLSGTLNNAAVGKQMFSWLNILSLLKNECQIFVDDVNYKKDMAVFEQFLNSEQIQVIEFLSEVDEDMWFDLYINTQIPDETDFFTADINAMIKICCPISDSSLVPLAIINKINHEYNMCFVVSEYQQQSFINSGLHIDCLVLPKAVFLNHLLQHYNPNSSESKSIANFETNNLRFGMIASNDYNKNIAHTIKTFAKTFNKNDTVELFIHVNPIHGAQNELAKRQTMDAYAQYANQANIQLHTDKLSQSEYAQIFNSFDVLLLPSISASYYTMIIEALSMGIVVIASDIPSHRCLGLSDAELQDNIFFIPHNVEQLAYNKHFKMLLGQGKQSSVADYQATIQKYVAEVEGLYSPEKIEKRRKIADKFGVKGLLPLYQQIIFPEQIIYENDHSFVDAKAIYIKSKVLADKYRQIFPDLISLPRSELKKNLATYNNPYQKRSNEQLILEHTSRQINQTYGIDQPYHDEILDVLELGNPKPAYQKQSIDIIKQIQELTKDINSDQPIEILFTGMGKIISKEAIYLMQVLNFNSQFKIYLDKNYYLMNQGDLKHPLWKMLVAAENVEIASKEKYDILIYTDDINMTMLQHQINFKIANVFIYFANFPGSMLPAHRIEILNKYFDVCFTTSQYTQEQLQKQGLQITTLPLIPALKPLRAYDNQTSQTMLRFGVINNGYDFHNVELVVRDFIKLSQIYDNVELDIVLYSVQDTNLITNLNTLVDAYDNIHIKLIDKYKNLHLELQSLHVYIDISSAKNSYYLLALALYYGKVTISSDIPIYQELYNNFDKLPAGFYLLAYNYPELLIHNRLLFGLQYHNKKQGLYDLMHDAYMNMNKLYTDDLVKERQALVQPYLMENMAGHYQDLFKLILLHKKPSQTIKSTLKPIQYQFHNSEMGSILENAVVDIQKKYFNATAYQFVFHDAHEARQARIKYSKFNYEYRRNSVWYKVSNFVKKNKLHSQYKTLKKAVVQKSNLGG